MAATQGYWEVWNTAASHRQGPPQRPPFGPPTHVAAQRNTFNLNPNASNSAARPIFAPPTTPGAQYGAHSSQLQPNHGMLLSSNLARPNSNEDSNAGMLPSTPVSSGLHQGIPNNIVSSQQPPQQPSYHGYSSNIGMGPLQQMGPPWMQSAQQFQRPSYMVYPGNYPGPLQAQMRPLGPSVNAMPVGPAPGLLTSGQVAQRPVIWTQEHPGPPAARSPIMTTTTTTDSTRSPIGSSRRSVALLDNQLNLSGSKTEKGPSQVAVDPADVWTAHKTDNGAVYYYNSVTAQSTYTRPDGFKGEPAKVTTHPTPVSWERLSPTDWALVTTDDGKKYYYNTKSQASCWEVPSEVAELRMNQEEVSGKLVFESVPTGISPVDKSPVSFTLNVSVSAGGRETTGHKPGADSALDLIKKKLQDAGAQVTVSPTTGTAPVAGNTLNGVSSVDASNGKGLGVDQTKDKPQKGDNKSSEESSDSEEEDPGATKEEKVNEFKEMLKEKGVAPFSKWEKELPKIIFDPRFKAIPSHTERRSIFEHYVRTRADVERREKRAAQKAAIEGFKQLLEEAAKESLITRLILLSRISRTQLRMIVL